MTCDVTCFPCTEGSLFGGEGTDKELPAGGEVTLSCPIPDLPDRTITWHRMSGGVLSTERELSVTQAGLYFCMSTDVRGRFVSDYISVYNQGGATAGERGFPLKWLCIARSFTVVAICHLMCVA